MSNKTSDKNVANVTKNDIDILNALIYVYEARLPNYNELMDSEVSAIKNILSDYTRQKQINEEHQKINGELRERVKELEEENKNLKAQHIFTRNNNATDKEKAELYDVIDKTIDTFLEQEKPIWQQEMIKDKMSLEEALSIVDEMYQNKYKIIEKNNTIYVDKLNDIKFTSLEFASVRLLREVQSLQSNLENSIPKQKVKEILDDIYDYFERLNGPDEDIEYIENKRKELLEE